MSQNNDTAIALLSDGSDLEQHATAVMYEGIADELKLQAILKRGELYKEFDGTQRECGEHFGVDKQTVNDYLTIFTNLNPTSITDRQEISKNKLLTIIREKKAEEANRVEDFDVTRENLHGGATYKSEEAEELADEVIELSKDASPEVKQKLLGKSMGMGKKKEVLKSDLSDDKKVEALTSKKKFDEVFAEKEDEPKEQPKEQPKSHQQALEQNKLLREENKKLRDENKMLTKKLKNFNFIEELSVLFGDVNGFLMGQISKVNKNEKLLKSMPKDLVAALNALKLSTMEIPSMAELKRNYKDEAKKNHPDKNDGSDEKFHRVKDAFDVVKSFIK